MFTSLAGKIVYDAPNASDPSKPSAYNCTGTLSPVPGARLPFQATRNPLIETLGEYQFIVQTMLPLDSKYVAANSANNPSSVFCSTVDNGSYRPNAVLSLPAFPMFALGAEWVAAVHPTAGGTREGPTRSLDSPGTADFDYEGPHVRFQNVDGSDRPPVGVWKGHIHSTLHIWSGATFPQLDQ